MKSKNFPKHNKKEKLKKIRVKTTCNGSSDMLEWNPIADKRPKARRLRCNECGKRFMTLWFDCGDSNCWHETFPKHVKYI